MSAWSSFRQHWLKPDVYPLIAVMGTALSIGGYALVHTAHNPAVHWDSDERRRGVRPFEGDEHRPGLTRFRNRSVGAFARDTAIWDHLNVKSEPLVFTIRRDVADEGSDEEEEQRGGDSDVQVVDEAKEVIDAAIDGALGGVAREGGDGEDGGSVVVL